MKFTTKTVLCSFLLILVQNAWCQNYEVSKNQEGLYGIKQDGKWALFPFYKEIIQDKYAFRVKRYDNVWTLSIGAKQPDLHLILMI